jgi:hypothetical protein
MLRTFCEKDWSTFGVGLPLEGSLDKVNRVFKVVVGKPKLPKGHVMVPYIDCWQDASPQSAHMAKALPRESM